MAAISVSSAWNSTFGNGTNSSFSTLPPAARKPSLKEARDSSPAAYFQVMNTAFLWPLSAMTLPSGCTGCQLENDVRNPFGVQSAPDVFRTSFSNWQPVHPLGKVMADRGHKKAVFITWKYAAGEESLASFKEGFLAAGGSVEKELFVPFPNVEFQALLTEIAAIKPDAVACFFAGGGAVKFVKDYAAAGLKDKIPLYGSGFLTEGVLTAQGEAADGLLTTLHYADSLDNPRNKVFRPAYAKAYKTEPDVYAVQGYDTGLLLAQALDRVKGDIGNQKAVIAAMEGAVIDSPRGQGKMSKAHNPIQDIYLRRVEKGDNKVIGVAWKALEDPARGCKFV